MAINFKKKMFRGFGKHGNVPAGGETVSDQEQKQDQKTSVLNRFRYTPAYLRPGNRPRSRKEKLIIIIPAMAAILAVCIVMFMVNRVSVYKLKDTASQYYGGSAVHIEKGTQLRSDSEGTVSIKSGKQNIETTLPIYLDNSRKVILPVDMLYVSPRIGGCSRVGRFSEVECKENQMITVYREGKKADTERGFLYDGEDFYLFLEPVTVSFNGYNMDLPALSYVEAVYGEYMMLFNYDTKETFMELSDGTGTAQPASGDYVISLLGDSMTLNNGNKILLANRPELFDPVV